MLPEDEDALPPADPKPPAPPAPKPAPAPADPAAALGAPKPDLREAIIETLQTCYDPEIPVNIYDLGLIYGIDVDPQGRVRIEMTLTSPACPVAETLPPDVRNRVALVEGVTSVEVVLVWDPPWGKHLLSDAARLQLGLD